jgi:hypothetical protein
MKRSSTVFLQIVIVLIGIGALAFLLWEPHIEGRNKHATLFQIYFNDSFLAYAYTGSIAFFVALYQAFKLLGYVARNEVFSQRSVKALRTIKYCALTLVAFLVGAEAQPFEGDQFEYALRRTDVHFGNVRCFSRRVRSC